MTVIHPHPHPLARTVVTPSNTEIFKRFGKVRIEDWDDRVAGLTWAEQLHQGNYPQAQVYSQDDGSLPPSAAKFDVVRCHMVTTGQVVLLHNDWLPQQA